MFETQPKIQPERESSLRKVHLGAAVACAFAVTFAGASFAQDIATQAKVAQFGGQMHAVAQKCGGYTQAQLDSLKAQQRAAIAGMSASDFDAAFNDGLEQARQRIASGTPEQIAQMCKTLPSLIKP